MEREIRTQPTGLEVRTVDGKATLTGYAIVWDAPSKDLGGFIEVIRRGATLNCLVGATDIYATIDHELETRNILGSRDNKTLTLWEDDKGLAFSVIPPATTTASDVIANVSAGNVRGVSFAFYCARDNWLVGQDGQRIREVLEFSALDEISIVVRPAYPQTSVEAAKRSLAEWEQTQKPQGETVEHALIKLELVALTAANGYNK